VKVTGRLNVSVSTLVTLFLCEYRRRKLVGLQGCRHSVLYLALMLDEDRDSELYGTVT
jgi:hypothetical protein